MSMHYFQNHNKAIDHRVYCKDNYGYQFQVKWTLGWPHLVQDIPWVQKTSLHRLDWTKQPYQQMNSNSSAHSLCLTFDICPEFHLDWKLHLLSGNHSLKIWWKKWINYFTKLISFLRQFFILLWKEYLLIIPYPF